MDVPGLSPVDRAHRFDESLASDLKTALRRPWLVGCTNHPILEQRPDLLTVTFFDGLAVEFSQPSVEVGLAHGSPCPPGWHCRRYLVRRLTTHVGFIRRVDH